MTRRRSIVAAAALAAVAALATTAWAGSPPSYAPPGTGDPVINVPDGYSYTTLAEGCVDTATSTESGLTFPMPDDRDGNAVVNAPGGKLWLFGNHELTQPRPGDWQGDFYDCHVDEQATTDDGDYTLACRCGSPRCRGTITGKDWTRPELRARYRGWFCWFLQRKIDAEQTGGSR